MAVERLTEILERICDYKIKIHDSFGIYSIYKITKQDKYNWNMMHKHYKIHPQIFDAARTHALYIIPGK